MTKAKENGGLGIRSMRNLNIALMVKLGWRFLSTGNDLWARVLQNKYMKGRVELAKIKKKPSSSNDWRGIMEGTNVNKKGISAKVYNGKDAFFLEGFLGGGYCKIN